MSDTQGLAFRNEGVSVRSAPNCYLSGEEGELVYQGLRDHLFASPGNWNIRRSPRFPFYWLDPRPQEAEIGKLYRGYHTQNPSSLSFLGRRNKTKWKLRKAVLAGARDYPGGRWERRIGKWLSLIWFLRHSVDRSVMWLKGPAGCLLDVGCGNGRFLKKMEFMGWQVKGIELDGASADAARSLGLEVHHGTLESSKFKEASFQAISMIHVLEHVLDPLATLKECHRLLTPGGQLVLVTPNVLSLGHAVFREDWRGLEVPRHLYLFSPQALSHCVERANLKVAMMRTESRPARGIFRDSRLARNVRTFGRENLPKDDLTEKMMGRAFQWWEGFRCWFAPVGEEIVLVAEKQ